MAEITITTENFDAEVLSSEMPVIIDFWAVWCGPCKMISPVISEIAEEYEGKVKVGKVNVDEAGELAVRFGVSSIPTVVLFEGGKITHASVGYRTKEELTATLGL